MKTREKLIVVNDSDLPMTDAIEAVLEVVKMGKISNNNTQYCYATRFQCNGKNYIVRSDVNYKSDKLTVRNDESNS